MKWTNTRKLAEPFVEAVKKSFSSHNAQADISVTGLIRPPQMRILEKRHAEEMVVDVSDGLWSMFGSMLHSLLSQFSGQGAKVEERLFAEILGWKVSGQPDVFWPDSGLLEDYKYTSVYSFIAGKIEWTQQLNCYAYLESLLGRTVKMLRIQAILRDHMDSKVLPNGDYPENKVMELDLPLWDSAAQKEFLELRVKFHQDAEKKLDDELPECTSEEMWEKPEAWAVKKRGADRAFKVIRKPGVEGNDEAMALAQKKGPDYFVEHRTGERKRCEKYCRAAPFCHQFAQYKSVAWNKGDKTQTHEQTDMQ